MEMKSILREISRWSEGDEAATFVNLMAFANYSTFVINEGVTGMSKSRISSELARFLKLATDTKDEQGCYLSPVVVFNGKTTDKGLYQFIKQHKTKAIIFDDISTLSRTQLGLLKDITGENHRVGWISSFDEQEDSFVFEGSMVINTNIEGTRRNRDLEAIKSRAYVSHFFLNPIQIKQKKATYWEQQLGREQPNVKVWREIRERILDMKYLKLEKSEIVKIMEFVETIPVYHNSTVSMRDDALAMKLATFIKSFWGKLGDEEFRHLFSVIRSFYADGEGKKESDTLETLKEYLKIHNKEAAKRLDFAHVLCIKYGKQLRQAQNYIRNAIDSGEIEVGDNEWFIQVKKPNHVAKTVVEAY